MASSVVTLRAAGLAAATGGGRPPRQPRQRRLHHQPLRSASPSVSRIRFRGFRQRRRRGFAFRGLATGIGFEHRDRRFRRLGLLHRLIGFRHGRERTGGHRRFGVGRLVPVALARVVIRRDRVGHRHALGALLRHFRGHVLERHLERFLTERLQV